MLVRVAVVALVLLGSTRAWAQSPIEILGRSGSTRVPADAGVEAPTGPADCPAESWTFEVTLPSATIDPPSVWAASGFSCSLGERSQPGQSCFELCGVSRSVCEGSLAPGSSRYRFSIPSRWLVDPQGGQCVAASGRRAVFLVVNGEVVALSPRRVRYDLLPPAPPRDVDLTNYEDHVDVRWSYGNSGAGATDAGVTDAGVTDAGVTDAGDAGEVTDAGSVSAANGGEESVARFYVLCDPPVGMEGAASDAGTGCGTGALDALDVRDDAALARYRCAEPTGATARAATLSQLRNLARYRVGVVAEDLSGNRSRVAQIARCATPQAVTDFWEGYRAEGGRGQPGLCAARPWARGDAGAAVALLLGAAGVLARRRRR